MRLSLVTLLLAGTAHQAAAASCNADDCLRAVRATNAPGPHPSESDCSAYLRPTIIPVTTTTLVAQAVTITTSIIRTTVTTYRIVPFNRKNKEKRAWGPPQTTTIWPSVVPAYATTCTGAASTVGGLFNPRFTSACSCIGVSTNANTVVIRTSTTTVSTTSTPTLLVDSTSTIPAQATANAFKLQVASPGPQQGYIDATSDQSTWIAKLTTYPNYATTFYIGSDGTLFSNNGLPITVGSSPVSPLYFWSTQGRTGWSTLKCTFDSNLIATCSSGGRTEFGIKTNGQIYMSSLNTNWPSQSCQGPVKFKAVPWNV
ncbi:hypothetical protein ABW21_db0203040 [Orbilia brochopaga]|nr:hypothetical protein ABW21_db0203040 [Drechslerella brochopaga]